MHSPRRSRLYHAGLALLALLFLIGVGVLEVDRLWEGKVIANTKVAERVVGKNTKIVAKNAKKKKERGARVISTTLSSIHRLSSASRSADLRIGISGPSFPVSAGARSVGIRFQIFNDGPHSSGSMDFTVSIPNGMVVSGFSRDCRRTDTEIRCTLDAMQAGGVNNFNVFEYGTKTDAPCVEPLTITATIEGTEADPNKANNQAIMPITVQCASQSSAGGVGASGEAGDSRGVEPGFGAADLHIGIDGSSTPDPVDRSVGIQFQITNDGPHSSGPIDFTAGILNGAMVGNLDSTYCKNSTTEIHCTLPAMEVGGINVIKTKIVAPCTTSLTITATIEGTEADPNKANNQAIMPITVQCASQSSAGGMGASGGGGGTSGGAIWYGGGATSGASSGGGGIWSGPFGNPWGH